MGLVEFTNSIGEDGGLRTRVCRAGAGPGGGRAE